MSYTKLANSILTSTIWMEDDETRIVWLTLLAMADKNGEVQASIPGLANVARVSVQGCHAAIDKFLAPDPYSRTKDDEGRRIEEIRGGWSLINHAEYRNLASDEDRKQKAAERQRRCRDRAMRNSDERECHNMSHQNSQAEAEAEAEAEESISADASLAKASNKDQYEAIRIAFDNALLTKSRITAKRATQLNARLKDPWWRENWESAIARAAESEFLRGKNAHGWRADFEWFCKPDSANAILEGKYDNRDGEMGEFLRVLTTCLTQQDPAERKRILGAELHEACKRTDIEVIRQARDGRMLKNISAIFYQNLKDVRNSRQQSQNS